MGFMPWSQFRIRMAFPQNIIKAGNGNERARSNSSGSKNLEPRADGS